MFKEVLQKYISLVHGFVLAALTCTDYIALNNRVIMYYELGRI